MYKSDRCQLKEFQMTKPGKYTQKQINNVVQTPQYKTSIYESTVL